MQKGRYDDALVLISSETQGKIDSLELSEHYLKPLQMTGKMDEALAYAKKHLSMLIRNNQKQKVLNLFGKMEAKGAVLSDPEDLCAIAGWLRERHGYKKAFSCYADIVKSHNGYKHLPGAYFELAQIIYEQGEEQCQGGESSQGNDTILSGTSPGAGSRSVSGGNIMIMCDLFERWFWQDRIF